MLELTPEFERQIKDRTKSDDAITCVRCDHLITRGRWSISVGGGAHKFTNPLGINFDISCFEFAPGSQSVGQETEQHTWFAGYRWSIVLCKGCQTHLGWRYSGDKIPYSFFGLIKAAISSLSAS